MTTTFKAKRVIPSVYAWQINLKEQIPGWANKKATWSHEENEKPWMAVDAPRFKGGWQTCSENDYLILDHEGDIWSESKEFFESNYMILSKVY